MFRIESAYKGKIKPNKNLSRQQNEWISPYNFVSPLLSSIVISQARIFCRIVYHLLRCWFYSIPFIPNYECFNSIKRVYALHLTIDTCRHRVGKMPKSALLTIHDTHTRTHRSTRPTSSTSAISKIGLLSHSLHSHIMFSYGELLLGTLNRDSRLRAHKHCAKLVAPVAYMTHTTQHKPSDWLIIIKERKSNMEIKCYCLGLGIRTWHTSIVSVCVRYSFVYVIMPVIVWHPNRVHGERRQIFVLDSPLDTRWKRLS